MRHNPLHATEDEATVRALIDANPWATLVSRDDRDELVASHYPVLLDPDADGIALLTHVGRPDERVHGFADREIMVIIAGPHGYISPSWYGPKANRVPTWNFSVAHCYGVPEILTPEENVRTLERLVAHFERAVKHPLWLEPEVAERMSPGTVGLRIPVSRFVCKVKMSRDKDPQSQRQVLAELRGDGPYANPPLADAMQQALDIEK